MLFAIVGLSLLSWASVATFDRVLLQSQSAARADATHTLQESLEFIERMIASEDGCNYVLLNSIDPSQAVPSSEPDSDDDTVDLHEYYARLRTSPSTVLAANSSIGTHRIEEIRLILHQILGHPPFGMAGWERRTATLRIRTRARSQNTESASSLISDIPLSVVVGPFGGDPRARSFISCQSARSNHRVRGVECPSGTLFNGYNADRTLRCEREELSVALTQSCPSGQYIQALHGGTPVCAPIPDISASPSPTPSTGSCIQNAYNHDLHAIVVRGSSMPNTQFIPAQTYFQIGFARNRQECQADGENIVAISNTTVQLQNTDGFVWGCYARGCPTPLVDGNCVLPADWNILIQNDPIPPSRLVGRIGNNTSDTQLGNNPFVLERVTIRTWASNPLETTARDVVLGWDGGNAFGQYSKISLYRMAAGSYLSCNSGG